MLRQWKEKTDWQFLWKPVQTIEGKQHEMVQWKCFQIFAFVNFSKKTQDALAQFFNFVHDNVIVSTLAFYLQLPNKSFIHVLVVLTVFFLLLFSKLLYFPLAFFHESCCHFFLKHKEKGNCVQCCHGNLGIPCIFAVILLLCRNNDTINQWNLWNFLAYIILIY